MLWMFFSLTLHQAHAKNALYVQMTKLAIIPCTVILETLFFRKKFRLVSCYIIMSSVQCNSYHLNMFLT
jgi:hypothetical protein